MAARDTHRRRTNRRATASVPDLTPILREFNDARALIVTAYDVLKESDYAGPESSVIRQGIEKLNKVHTQIERAARVLSKFRRRKP